MDRKQEAGGGRKGSEGLRESFYLTLVKKGAVRMTALSRFEMTSTGTSSSPTWRGDGMARGLKGTKSWRGDFHTDDSWIDALKFHFVSRLMRC